MVLSEQSRVIMEPGDESLSLYYLLTITNRASTPVNPPSPFEFEMPSGAGNATVLEGSSPRATANGLWVHVAGPFPPGDTVVQVATSIAIDRGTLDIAQHFPAPFETLAVIVRKLGDLKLTSPQLTRQQDIPDPATGETAIVGEGGTIAAGQTFVLTLSGLAHHSAVPRWTALMLALGIVVVGTWASSTSEESKDKGGDRQPLVARREKLFQELVRLENDRRNNRGDRQRYATRREELVAGLEQLYGALDTDEANIELSGAS